MAPGGLTAVFAQIQMPPRPPNHGYIDIDGLIAESRGGIARLRAGTNSPGSPIGKRSHRRGKLPAEGRAVRLQAQGVHSLRLPLRPSHPTRLQPMSGVYRPSPLAALEGNPLQPSIKPGQRSRLQALEAPPPLHVRSMPTRRGTQLKPLARSFDSSTTTPMTFVDMEEPMVWPSSPDLPSPDPKVQALVLEHAAQQPAGASFLDQQQFDSTGSTGASAGAAAEHIARRLRLDRGGAGALQKLQSLVPRGLKFMRDVSDYAMVMDCEPHELVAQLHVAFEPAAPSPVMDRGGAMYRMRGASALAIDATAHGSLQNSPREERTTPRTSPPMVPAQAGPLSGISRTAFFESFGEADVEALEAEAAALCRSLKMSAGALRSPAGVETARELLRQGAALLSAVWDAAEERGIQPSSALLAEICGYQISPRDVTSHPASLGASRDASRPELRGGLDDRLAPRVAAVGFPQPGSRSSLAPSILPPGASRGPSILPPGASRRVDEYVPAEGTTRPPSARFRSSRGVAPIY